MSFSSELVLFLLLSILRRRLIVPKTDLIVIAVCFFPTGARCLMSLLVISSAPKALTSLIRLNTSAFLAEVRQLNT